MSNELETLDQSEGIFEDDLSEGTFYDELEQILNESEEVETKEKPEVSPEKQEEKNDEEEQTSAEESEEKSEEELDIELADNQKLEPVEGDIILEADDFKEYPEMSTFVGKKLPEVFKAYSSANKLITSTRTENKALRSENDTLAFEAEKLRVENEELKKAPKTQAAPEEEFDVDDMPDPVEDPDGFKKYMKKAKNMLTKKPEAPKQEEVQVDPIIAQNEQIVSQTVQSQLPQDVSLNEAVQVFVGRNAKILKNPDGSLNQENFNVLLKNPAKMIQDILISGRDVAEFRSKKKPDANTLTQKAKEETQKLKKGSKNTLQESRSTVTRTSRKGYTEEEKLLADIADNQEE